MKQMMPLGLRRFPFGGNAQRFASTVAADEYGSAAYVNGRSDMGATVATAESSMGPRRQPLSIITTTASLIQSGPFVEMLDSTKQLLLKEIEWDSVT